MAMNPRLLVPRATFDPDAAAYLAAVEAADGQALETPVKRAVDAFFRDTKAAGVFDALEACCILAGARTLAGALVPVVGDAPTNFADGFASGDYSRTAGLTGDGATTYLDSGYAIPGGNQDNCHLCVYGSDLDAGSLAGTDVAFSSRRLLIYSDPTQTIVSINNGNVVLSGAGSTTQGFIGGSRSSSSAYTARANGANYSPSQTSTLVSGLSVYIYGVNRANALQGGVAAAARFTFYSIGTAVDLEALDTAVTNLITAIGEAL